MTAAACTSGEDCPTGQRCEPLQGVCQAPCAQASDCAPGVDPRVASLLYVCQAGDCLRVCFNDAVCGTGALCEAGTCAPAACATRADCPSGQYCTSATRGRCLEYQTCESTAACGPNTECRAFPPGACPPGFDCASRICQELTACLLDTDCPASAYCRDAHCQPGGACTADAGCAPGFSCVAQRCVPGGCRGSADCPVGEACTDGACHPAPEAARLVALVLSPRANVLVVGDSLPLTLMGYTLEGTSFPLAQASYTGVDADGAPSGAVTVSSSGRVTAVAAGTVRVRAEIPDAAVASPEAVFTVLPGLDKGRRVTVVDAATRLPLAGVEVLGCEAPPASGPCPAPVRVTTDAHGVALFPGSTAATVSFSATSPETRADGYPRRDRVSVAATPARDVLLPLEDNPVHGSAGFTASIGFGEVHSSGELWLGVSLLSVGDPVQADLTTLLGDTFLVTPPGLAQRVPAPGSLVAYASLGLAGTVEIKPRSLGRAQAGRRTAVAFAGKLPLALATSLRPTDVLATLGAMDFTLQAFTPLASLTDVPDGTDLDGDGLCADPARCRASEDVPDYARFPGISHRPRREQLRRTEVVLSPLPAGLDTTVVAAVEGSAEAGLVPLGLTSRTGSSAEPVLLRSGAPYGGAEGGVPGVWAFATSATSGASVSGVLVRGPTLATRVILPPFLPLPGGAYSSPSRVFTPSAASWSALARAGAGLARVTLTGARSRHVVYLALRAEGGAVGVPDSAGGDPAGEAGVVLEVAALRLTPGVSPEELLELSGDNLLGLSGVVDGYSRSRPP